MTVCLSGVGERVGAELDYSVRKCSVGALPIKLKWTGHDTYGKILRSLKMLNNSRAFAVGLTH